MRILIVSATAAEAESFMKVYSLVERVFQSFRLKEHEVSLLITGVGMTRTAFALGSLFTKEKFDLAINIGVAGSFNKKIAIGDVVNVVQDRFGDLGAEDDEVFLDEFNLKLADANEFPFREGWIDNETVVQSGQLHKLLQVRAVTVNKVHGNEKNILKIVTHYQPDIESMEGAAFCYACAMRTIPYLQIRSVSNKVERRNQKNWNIPLAVKKLNDWVSLFLEEQK